MHISHTIVKNDEWKVVKTGKEWYEVTTTDDNCMFVDMGRGFENTQYYCMYDTSVKGGFCMCNPLFL